MIGKNKLKLQQLKSKNSRDKSSFLHLHEVNQHRDKALITFTVLSFVDKQLQLILIKEIKNHFIQLLRNSSIDVGYWAQIELGKSLANPHTHIQLYFEEENIDKVKKAFQKTIDYFYLDIKRCKMVEENKELNMNSSFNYVIKELDNKVMTDDEILLLDKARSLMKKGKAKNIQLFSKSRLPYPHKLYTTLFFGYQLKYVNVNYLLDKGFSKRLQGRALLEARQNKKLPYITFKNGAIKIQTIKLYSLIRLFLCFTLLIKLEILQKSVYTNKNYILIRIKTKNKKFIIKLNKKVNLYHQLE